MVKGFDTNRKSICCIIQAALSEMLLDGFAAFQQSYGDLLKLFVYYAHEIEEEAVDSAEVRKRLREADLVLLDLRGSGKATTLTASALADGDNTVVCLVGASPEILALLRMGSLSLREMMSRNEHHGEMRMSGMQRIQKIMRWIERFGDLAPIGRLRHARNWNKAVRYWLHGGPENVKNLLVMLGREYFGWKLPEPQEPREFPEIGIYDPLGRRYYENFQDYCREVGFDPAKPSIGLLFYGGMHFSQSVAGAAAMAQRLAQHYNLIPVYATTGHNLRAVREYFLPGGKAIVQAIYYLQWFQLATFSGEDDDNTLDLLKSLNVPVFTATPLFGRETAKWLESSSGLSPVEIMTTVILPELDGMIEPVPSMGLEPRYHVDAGQAAKITAPIGDRIDYMAARIGRRVALGRIPNHAKKVAFIIYNNPPGEDNIGNASYLDVFASLRKIFQAMRDRGYVVEDLPENGEILRRLIATGSVNNGRWVPLETAAKGATTMSTHEYRQIWSTLPNPHDVIASWGEPPGEIMVADDRIVLPGIELGNVFLGLQPARGIHSDPDKITHDKTLPPHHQYIAFYRWLERHWRADAVVHVGTHGTLEFLKGKEVGMSRRCYPPTLIGSVPHFYLYHVVNPSEAMIAKRRGLATIINHNSPSLTAAGLYEDYTALEELIAEYFEAQLTDPGRAERLAGRIRDRAQSLHLTKENVAEIQEELVLMKRSLIPKGLYIIGEEPQLEETIETVTAFLRYDRGKVPSLNRLLACKRNLDYDRLLDAPAEVYNGIGGAALLADLDREARELVRKTIVSGRPAGDAEFSLTLGWALELQKRLTARREITALLDALEGAYTEPGIGGEPIRDPDCLPTGRNSFQFDPRLVPSEAAYERGVQIAENTLQHYRGLTGGYPRSVGVVLWAFETAKTRGETVGQIFGYLGIKPVRKSVWKTDLEIIPTHLLGRPRIDVTVQICGFFRDIFMNVVELINQAFAMVAELNEGEEENFVRAHTQAAFAELSKGMESKRAWRVASGRVYGPRPGEYGTRVTSLIETGAWETESQIVDTFMASMNHLYTDNIHGERLSDLHREHIGRIEMISQVRDTHDYEIADLDHYYEYFGGLARTVETVRGRAPVQLITDTTKERLRTETVREALERGIRTRLLNPRWIEALLAHDVHGAQKISDRVQYLIGFAATTHAVPNWVFSAVAERYLFDPVMRRRMMENNVYATEEITRRLLEAYRRGYWQASDDELNKLREVYLETEGAIEDGIG